MKLRFDRLAALYLGRPLCEWRSDAPSVPILMYHSISATEERRHPYYRTATSPNVFANHIRYLHDKGYRTCGLAEATNSVHDLKSKSKLVVITFDDGFVDFYAEAAPVLAEYGFTATVFLPTAFIANSRSRFQGRECLTWAEIRELNHRGFTFGSHTVNHPLLWQMSPSEVNDEVVQSKEKIEQETGAAVTSFAYPFAFPRSDDRFVNVLRGLLQGAGYENGVCTTVGRACRKSDPFFLERLPVNSCDDPAFFEAKLIGAYDWIGTFQGIVKRAKTRFGKSYNVSPRFALSRTSNEHLQS